VLQEGTFERVGGSQPIATDARVIAATNRELAAAVAAGTFRNDLFYRLNVFPIPMPPLRQRREDIPILVEYFAARYAARFGKRFESIEKSSMERILDYAWPGNVRELQNVIERCVVLADGPRIELNDLPVDVLLPDHRARVRDAAALPLNEATEEFERQIVLRVLERVRWNRSEAARILGIHRNSLKVKLVRWRLADPASDQ
jgi:DNA-binding NtrC family response regulator